MEQQPEESSFSHIWAHIQEHQCAMMTAFRGSNTRDINTKNNHTLLSTLKYLGYRVTKVIGTYPERVEDESGSVNDKTIKEELFFIVNRGDDPDFEKYIIKMSQSAKKNSVLIIPKGGKDAYVFDINDADWPGKGEKVIIDNAQYGAALNNYMSKVLGPGFVVESTEDVAYRYSGMFDYMLHKLIAKQFLDD